MDRPCLSCSKLLLLWHVSQATNELFYAGWRDVVGAEVLDGKLLPQAHHIIRHTLLSVRDTLETNPEVAGFAAFNVFGFDLMVDDAHQVHLIEVNSSPAVADELNGKLAADLVAKEISPYFDGCAATAEAGRGTSAASLQMLDAERARGTQSHGWSGGMLPCQRLHQRRRLRHAPPASPPKS